MRFLSKLLIFALALWAVYTSLSAFFGVDLLPVPDRRRGGHPLSSLADSADRGVPDLRLLRGDASDRRQPRDVPDQFLETYVKILTVTGAILFYRSGVPAGEYAIVAFFAICSRSCPRGARISRNISRENSPGAPAPGDGARRRRAAQPQFGLKIGRTVHPRRRHAIRRRCCNWCWC